MPVLRLLRHRKANSEIGAALFVSRKTASVQGTNILRKFDVSTRGEAVAVPERVVLLRAD